MMFVFAYLGSLSTAPGWPIGLMYLTEAAFVIVALFCILLAVRLRRAGKSNNHFDVALLGGISASFGLIMPFELAPFFFNAKGETMLGTVVLIFAYPIVAILFVFLFAKFMKVTRDSFLPLS
jgi:hypothetical protein